MSYMSYATVEDVQARMIRSMTSDEQSVCTALLTDAAVMIDTYAPNASADAKKVVSCRMVLRAIGDGDNVGVPVGASSGSMSGLGYSQSWSIGNNGSTGELYFAKTDRQLLGIGNAIGSWSPVQELVRGATDD